MKIPHPMNRGARQQQQGRASATAGARVSNSRGARQQQQGRASATAGARVSNNSSQLPPRL